jgi:Tol biopolymer transport system component
MDHATRNTRNVKTVLMAAAMASLLAACGGGGDDTAAALDDSQASAAAADVADDQRQERASAPAAGTLRLASSNSSGRAATFGAAGCGLSANGSVAAFTSNSDNLVAGDTNQRDDVFVKDLRSGVTTRASTLANGAQIVDGGSCNALSADGRYVVFTANVGTGLNDLGFALPSETVLFVRDISSGTVTRVSPPAASLPTTAGFAFQSISDNGQRVAFIALPTSRYLGGYLTVADGPARPLVFDLASRSVRDLSTAINITTGNDLGSAVLSSDGAQLAFVSGVDQARAGDSDGKPNVFVLSLASNTLRVVSTVASSVSPSFFGPPTFQSPHTIYGFRNNDSRLLFYAPGDSTLGASGVYAISLASGAIDLLVPDRIGFALTTFGADPLQLSFSANASTVAFTRLGTPRDEVFVRHLATGQEQRVAVTAAGVAANGRSTQALLSKDGSSVLFNADATNLVPLPRRTLRYQVYVKTLGAPPSL